MIIPNHTSSTSASFKTGIWIGKVVSIAVATLEPAQAAKNGAGRDIAVDQTARDEDEPPGEDVVHSFCHAATENQLAHQDEERDGDVEELHE